MSKQNVEYTIRETVDLAFTYAEDGAFHTAADRLQKAADLMREHAAFCDPDNFPHRVPSETA